MSSILDALKKLEEEKALANAQERGAEFRAEPMPSGRAGTGRIIPGSWTLQLSPERLLLIIGGSAFALTLVSVLVTYLLLRPGANLEASAIAAAPQTEPSAPAPSAVAMLDEDPVLEPTGRNEAEIAVEPPLSIVEEAADRIVEAFPVETAAVFEEPAVLTVAPEPPAPVVQEPAREPVLETAAAQAPAETAKTPPIEAPRREAPTRVTRTPVAGPAGGSSADRLGPARELPRPKAKGPASIKDLPLLSTAARMRHGLENLRVNMLVIKGPRTPRTFAMINELPINEGEIIPNTRAELIKVESHGIAIEIISTGIQYYIPS